MIKRTSLVWRKAGLSRKAFRDLWLGEHATIAVEGLEGLREYVIDFVEEPPGDAPDGIAVLRFDSLEACEAAFSNKEVTDRLMETREAFAERVEVFFVDEAIVFPQQTRD